MDLLEALTYIENGGKITREAWYHEDYVYITLNGKGDQVLYSDAGELLIMGVDDLKANDWKLVKEL